MEFPGDLLYTKEHEWAKIDGDTATIGITDFAQSELGDIVFVELPEVGHVLEKDTTFGVAESVKTVSDLYSPLGGEVVEINSAIEDQPELVNESPYGEGWLIKIKLADEGQVESLMSADDYRKLAR